MSATPGYEALVGVRNAIMAGLPGREAFTQPQPERTGEYYTLGPIQMDDDGNKSADGWEIHFQLSSWSTTAGQAPELAEQWLDDAAGVLHAAAILVAGFNVILCRQFTRPGVLQDPDGTTYQGVARYRMLIEKV